MMAAMAQQDCGQCGYNCNDYADAIAHKNEARLNLCVPGGKETARMLKALHEEIDSAPKASVLALNPQEQQSAPPDAAKPGMSRDCPADVGFLSRRRLNKQGSEKDTWHIEFDLSAAGLDYTVGNSFGVFPENDPALVREVLLTLWADPDEERGGRTLAHIVANDFSLSPAPELAVPALFIFDGRREAEQGEGARRWRRPGWRRRHPRRTRGSSQVLRGAPEC